MIGRREMERTLADGARNRDTMVLVRNWCANVRIEKAGGTGLLEQQTGLPIGHHGLACDYATDGSSYSWDLREAAVEFHDRYCRGCEFRKPVRLPNISELVGERDRKRAARAAERTEADAVAASEREARDLVRADLKKTLEPVACTLVDDIEAFDHDGSPENMARLLESARLAPEQFPPALIDYLFSIAETHAWFIEAGLGILRAIGADRARLARLAVRALSANSRSEAAPDVLLERLDVLGDDDIGSAVPAAMSIAHPDRAEHPSLGYRASHPELLQAMWRTHRGAVVAAIDRLLGSGRRHAVELVGRGLTALLATDPSAATPFARALISTYARAWLLVSDLKEVDRLPHLADAITGAFEDVPDVVDGLLQEYADGSDDKSRARVFALYGRAMAVKYGTAVPASSRRHRIAFGRTVWATTRERDQDVIDELRSAFDASSEGLIEIARAEIDALLGAALLLADRVVAIDAAPRPANEDWIAAMTRGNHRAAYTRLISSFVDRAAEGAAGRPDLVDKMADTFDAIPDDRDLLRGLFLGAFEHLAADVSGLRRFLPHLYHGLVGSSALVRSYAATAVGELSGRTAVNVPPLVFEAFQLLLWDQYVIVHKAALRALSRTPLPAELRQAAGEAVLNLIHHYRAKSGEEAFLVNAVRVAAGMAEEFGRAAPSVRRYLVEVAMGIDPIHLRSEMRSMSHSLVLAPDFAKLVARMLPAYSERFNQNDEGPALLQRLPPAGVLTHRTALEKAGAALARDDAWFAMHVAETLARAGADAEAKRVAQASLDALEDTRRNQGQRAWTRAALIAASFEGAVAARDDGALGDLARQWQDNRREAARLEEERRASDSRTGLRFPD